MTERPTTKKGFTKTDQLPAYLQEHGYFCLWKYTQRGNGSGWTKPPYQPMRPDRGADSTNKATFSDLQTAARAGTGFDGLGLGIFDDLAAVDIDHCIDDAGRLSKLAQTVIGVLDSYTEISPSGKGVRIIFRAPGLKYDSDLYYINRRDARDQGEEWPEQQGLEIYIAGSTSKFVTVTGDVYKAADVNIRSEEIMRIARRYMMKSAQTTATVTSSPSLVGLTDGEILDAATAAKDGDRFTALYYRGDWTGYASQSEADLALFNSLAFYTGGDVARMIKLFMASELGKSASRKGRGKDKYLQRTAEKAANGCSSYYTPPRRQLAQKAVKSDEITKKSEEKATNAEKTESVKPSDSIGEVDAFMGRSKSKAFEPIPTGITDIDAALSGGFIRQTLVTLGAAPGAGKTILAQQIFESIAERGSGEVLYFNLEMSTEQLIARSLSRATGIPQLTVLQGYKWTQEQEYKITVAAQKYKGSIAPHIAYNPPDADGNRGSAFYQDILGIMEREADARDPQKPLLVVIDYLQLLRDKTGKGDDVETIKGALKAFKDFAIKRNAVVFLIMAHSRATNASGIVTQGAGRDTSAIEYSGDLQLALHYARIVDGTYRDLQDMEKAIKDRKDNATEKLYDARSLVVTKNRFGKDRARAEMVFIGEESRFVMVDKKHDNDRQDWKKGSNYHGRV